MKQKRIRGPLLFLATLCAGLSVSYRFEPATNAAALPVAEFDRRVCEPADLDLRYRTLPLGDNEPVGAVPLNGRYGALRTDRQRGDDLRFRDQATKLVYIERCFSR